MSVDARGNRSGRISIGAGPGGDIEHLNLVSSRIDPIEDAKVSDPKGPIALQWPDERLTQSRLLAQPLQGAVDAIEQPSIGSV